MWIPLEVVVAPVIRVGVHSCKAQADGSAGRDRDDAASNIEWLRKITCLLCELSQGMSEVE